MNPQRWNAYAYVSNNPLTMVDPDGREEEESWLDLAKRYLAAMFQPVSSVESLTNPGESSGPSGGPWISDHEMAVRATQQLGKGLDKLSDLYLAADPTATGALAKSAMMKDGTGTMLAAMGVVLPGGRQGGNIALSEAKQLVGGWAKGTFEKVGASIAYHFERHGAEVRASSVWQYLRKAEGFAKNLRGASRTAVENGAT